MARARFILVVAMLAVVALSSLPATAGATTPAPRPVGAGYVIARAGATSGNLRVTVPRLTCKPHENSELGALIQPLRNGRVNRTWNGSVAFRCVDGAARYRATMVCGGPPTTDVGALRPNDVVDISYAPNQVGIRITRGGKSTGAGCGWSSGGGSGGASTAAVSRSIAFLVKSLSRPPSSLRALTVHVRAGGKTLATHHPRARNQTISRTTQLQPGPIRRDGKTFTVRLQHR